MNVCSVIVSADSKCGAPAVVSFANRDGVVYHECVDHAPASALAAPAPVAPAAHPASRSVAPYLLVRDGKIVGYAYSLSADVRKRAARLMARIVPN